jgi:hypothetical protein
MSEELNNSTAAAQGEAVALPSETVLPGAPTANNYVIRSGKSWLTLSSGIEVQVKPVPMQVFMDINEEFKATEPQPPMELVPGAEDPTTAIPNYQNDAYRAAVQAWQYQIGVASTEAAIRLGVVCEVDPEAVKRLRDYYAKYRKTRLDEDDFYVYVKYVACVSEQDQVDLLSAVTRRSQPTEGAVASVIEQFPAIG